MKVFLSRRVCAVTRTSRRRSPSVPPPPLPRVPFLRLQPVGAFYLCQERKKQRDVSWHHIPPRVPYRFWPEVFWARKETLTTCPRVATGRLCVTRPWNRRRHRRRLKRFISCVHSIYEYISISVCPPPRPPRGPPAERRRRALTPPCMASLETRHIPFGSQTFLWGSDVSLVRRLRASFGSSGTFSSRRCALEASGFTVHLRLAARHVLQFCADYL